MSINRILVLLITILIAGGSTTKATAGNGPADPLSFFKNYTVSLYKQLHDHDLDFTAFETALKGYHKLKSEKKIINKRYLTIIDMSRSANKNRFFVIDMIEKKIVTKTKVAHGRNSGGEFAKKFSNKNGSYQTSLGFYKTAELYTGKHGRSMRLDGLESSNNNARARAIVIHSADYVSDSFINRNGRLGRSLGCPALPHKGFSEIIDMIKEGSVLFIYYPQESYLKSSQIANSNISKIFEKITYKNFTEQIDNFVNK